MMELASTSIIAAQVSEDGRMGFLPYFFGPRSMLRGESLVYAWMQKLSRDYTGGYWQFYTLNNGGFYLAPDLDHALNLEVLGNGFEGRLSADAAGIVATLFALGQLAGERMGDEADELAERYHNLREYALDHPEGGAILQAID